MKSYTCHLHAVLKIYRSFYQILWIIVTKYKENNDIAQAPHPKSPVSDAHSIGGGTCRQVLYQLVFTEYTERLIKKPCTAIGKKEGIIFTSFCFQSCLSHLLKNVLNPAVSSLPSMKLHHFHPHLNKPQISCVHMSWVCFTSYSKSLQKPGKMATHLILIFDMLVCSVIPHSNVVHSYPT